MLEQAEKKATQELVFVFETYADNFIEHYLKPNWKDILRRHMSEKFGERRFVFWPRGPNIE